MYLSHFNLKLKPFSLSPDSRFLWLGEKHSEALATLKYGIQENIGFLLLTGDIGTGKTALINRLIREIDVPSLVATIPDPGLEIIDFFNFLAFEFNEKRIFNSKGKFLNFFKKFLQNAYTVNKKVLIIIDEAQRLSSELLEEIRQLSNIELEYTKLLNIFFVGQSEFNKILAMEVNKATRQRIAVKYHIEPLTQEETELYIQHHLKIAGATEEIFKLGAIKEIYNFSLGFPRTINIICNLSLLTGYSKELKSIDEHVIKECAAELNDQNHIKANAEDKLLSSYKRIQGKINNFKLHSWGKKIEYVAVISKQEKDFIESNLENIISATRQKGNMRLGKGKKFTETQNVIYFNHNSIELLNSELQKLDRIAYYYLKNPKSIISIEGYTDLFGNYWYNKQLTRYRAQIVQNYLIKKKVSPNNLKVFCSESESQISTRVMPAGMIKTNSVLIEFPF